MVKVGEIVFGPCQTDNTSKDVTTDALYGNDNSAVSVQFTPYGRELGQYDVFMAIVSALSQAAERPADERVTGIFNSFFDQIDCQTTSTEVKPSEQVLLTILLRHSFSLYG